MRIFVPVEDAPGVATLGLLVPYRCGLVCEHAMRDTADLSGMDTSPSGMTVDRPEPRPARASGGVIGRG